MGYGAPRRKAYDVILLEDQKSSGTDGGSTFVSSWNTRTLNIKTLDTGSHCTLSSNQFSLAIGTYEIYARAPATLSNGHRIRLYNASAGTVEAYGSSMSANATYFGCNDSTLRWRFTITVARTFEIQHWVTSTAGGIQALGANAGVGVNEVYTQVWLWRLCF